MSCFQAVLKTVLVQSPLMPGTSSAVELDQGLFLGLLSATYQDAEHLKQWLRSATGSVTSPKHKYKMSFRCLDTWLDQ